MLKIRLMGKKEDMHEMIKKKYTRSRILKSWNCQIFTLTKVQVNMEEFTWKLNKENKNGVLYSYSVMSK